MTKEDIIRMAREAGVVIDGNNSGQDDLLYFAVLVAAAEREDCAKVCEEHTIPSELANAIRNGAMRDAKLNAGWGSEQQAETPPEWPLIKNILAEYGLGAISFVAEFKAAQRPWVDLTDEEIKATWSQLWYDLNHGKLSAPDAAVRSNVVVFGEALEAKLKERNHD